MTKGGREGARNVKDGWLDRGDLSPGDHRHIYTFNGHVQSEPRRRFS